MRSVSVGLRLRVLILPLTDLRPPRLDRLPPPQAAMRRVERRRVLATLFLRPKERSAEA